MNLKTIYKILLGDFRLHVAFTLSLVWILAVWHFRSVNSFVFPLLAIGLVTLCDLSITFVRDHKFYLPSAAAVSGFLIGLIIDPNQPFWVVTVVALSASLSKQFIRVGPRQHLFNPAAFGIMATSLVFETPISWWGVAWSKWPLVILIPLMIRILWRMKRLLLPFTFLIVYYWFYQSVKFDTQESIRILSDPTLLLFALVMLPEPITSPTVSLFKYWFGALVAFLTIGISQIRFLNDVFLPALLLGNLIGFLLLRLKTATKTPQTN